MSAEQATALLVALTGLVGALSVLVVQLRQMRKDLNGRLTELVETTKLAASKTGELAGRDFAARSVALSAEGRTETPTRIPDTST